MGSGSRPFYGYVDNIIVEPIPACQRPSSISAVSTTSDTVFLSWTDSYGSLWDLAYGPIGFDPDNATEATLETGIDTNAFTVTGLSYGTGCRPYFLPPHTEMPCNCGFEDRPFPPRVCLAAEHVPRFPLTSLETLVVVL